MPEESGHATDPAAASFADHVRAFHRSLPPDEQALLEEVFRLAELAEAAEVGDVQGHQLRQLAPDFFHGLIAEIGFPALDAGSKDAAKMTIKLAPEDTRTQSTTGGST